MLQADRLVALRKEKGLLQKELAKILGLERTTYAKYEKGGIQPPNDMIIKIAAYFSVTTDYLLGQTTNPMPPGKESVVQDNFIPDGIVYKGKLYTVDNMPPEVKAFIDMIGKTYIEDR